MQCTGYLYESTHEQEGVDYRRVDYRRVDYRRVDYRGLITEGLFTVFLQSGVVKIMWKAKLKVKKFHGNGKIEAQW